MASPTTPTEGTYFNREWSIYGDKQKQRPCVICLLILYCWTVRASRNVMSPFPVPTPPTSSISRHHLGLRIVTLLRCRHVVMPLNRYALFGITFSFIIPDPLGARHSSKKRRPHLFDTGPCMAALCVLFPPPSPLRAARPLFAPLP